MFHLRLKIKREKLSELFKRNGNRLKVGYRMINRKETEILLKKLFSSVKTLEMIYVSNLK